MGWDNPDISWAELERRLSGRPRPKRTFGPDEKPNLLDDKQNGKQNGKQNDKQNDKQGNKQNGKQGQAQRSRQERYPDRPRPWEPWNWDGDGSPGWERHLPYEAHPEATAPQQPVVPYAELHAHSNFSFLDGASDPETLIEESVRLGLHALALTDHDGFYGASRFAEAAKEYDLQTIFGAELSIGLRTSQNGIADPEGHHLMVLAAGVEGYRRLAGAITAGQLRGDEKGRPLYDLEELAAQSDGHWMIMTGCRKGAVRQALARGGTGDGLRTGVEAAAAELDTLTALFGLDHVVVELIDHGLPTDSVHNDALAALARDHGLPVVATNNVHYARPADYRLASAMAAVRARRSLGEMDGWLPPPTAFLRSGDEMAMRFARSPDAVARSVTLADQLAFDLQAASPRLPKLDVPDGYDLMSWLRELTRRGADQLYPHMREQAQQRLDKELSVIEAKGFGGYFLIVRDMVHFAKQRGILCQGRGSAANSVICFTLGITAVDPILFDLPFERFLATTREEEPDIDVDFDSERREEVIQEVYRRFGRHNAAQVANVVAYRPKSAIRDMAKALGYSTGQQDAWSKQIDSWTSLSAEDHEVPDEVVELADQLLKAPRHLGIHSGGMVLTEEPVGQVCPIERGRMEDRTILQWDKDSCAWMGLVKFDFLGLGILNAIQQTFDLVDEWLGERWFNWRPSRRKSRRSTTWLCRADSVGSVPGRESGPDRHVAPVAAEALLRLGGRGGADPARPDSGWGGAPLCSAQHRQRRSDLSPSGCSSRCSSRTKGDPVVPGAVDADRDDGRQLQRGRRRSAPSGDGIQARSGKDRTAAGRSCSSGWKSTASPANWPIEIYDKIVRPSPTSASPRVPRLQLRPARLRLGLAQVALSRPPI